MSSPGVKQQQEAGVTVVALIEAMEKRMIERFDELRADMRRMNDTHNDILQVGVFQDYIFGKDGTFTQTMNDVKRHNKYEVVTNAIGALVILLLGSAVVQKVKRFFGVTQ